MDYVTRCFNLYRWTFWLIELIHLPIVANLVWAGTCSFETIREGFKYELVTFESIEELWGEPYKWFVLGAAIIGVIMGHVYNIVLLTIVNNNKISTIYHEQTITKKEVEFCLGINRTWSVGRYYTFASYKSGPMRMYHRIVFNIWAIYMVIGLGILVSSSIVF